MQELQLIIEEAFERRADITPRNVEPKVKDAVMAVYEASRGIPRTIGVVCENALLGGFAAIGSQISLESVNAAIREKFPTKVAEANVLAATEAHAFVTQEMREAARA